jgi:subtilisin family serine protease
MIKLLRTFPILIVFGILFALNISAQNPAKNWQNEDLTKDSVYGTSSDKALELLKGKSSTTVIVAVIDGGVYINHPALKGHIWVNPKEIPGNHIDDDKNGYVDDVNGWDFIGGKDSDVKQDNFEITRLYRDLSKKFANADPNKISDADKAEYKEYSKVKKNFEDAHNDLEKKYNDMKTFSNKIDRIKTVLGKSDYTKDDIEKYNPSDTTLISAKKRLIRDFDRGFTFDGIEKSVKGAMDSYNTSLSYQYNVNFNPRSIVGDNYTDASERNYGNNDVVGPTDVHATHVSGIIAGTRTGKTGEQEGIADNVKIMAVRVVPDGDERDKDVANGIRYAVDNGAKVVNMSFGKQYAYNKKTVDDAVKYAEAHDVLLVHAAGNERKDNDTTDQFPNPIYADNHKKATNWLEVGASDVHGKPAPFSNYGKKSVDLFAPGVKIYSSIPDSGYAYFNGTSMASPCAAGVAAIIREYFPTLTAPQVRKILMKSVTKITFKVPKPGHPEKMVTYKDLCVSGGLINAYKAVQLAMKMAK